MIKYLFGFLILSAVHAQEIKVIEIIDANLFRTSDSSLISMVNLEVPSLHDRDSNRIELAKKAVKLAKLHLLKQKLRFEETYKKKCFEGPGKAGHLFRVYPLSDKSINEFYLEKGYAIYSPCDTLYMDMYRAANLKSINNRLGIWKVSKSVEKPDMLNRFRLSFLVLVEYYESSLFPPLFGINYRWSDILTFVDQNGLNLNASVETGTLVYFALPYGNVGLEARFHNTYLRGHYDALLPIFFFLDAKDFDSVYFWGIDIGFIVPFGRNGIELEYNIKTRDGFYFNYFSISFAAY